MESKVLDVPPVSKKGLSESENIIMWGICGVCTLAPNVAKASLAISVPARSLLLFDLAYSKILEKVIFDGIRHRENLLAAENSIFSIFGQPQQSIF